MCTSRRDRQREREKQAPAEPWHRTPTQDPEIMTWAEGRRPADWAAQAPSPQPHTLIFNTVSCFSIPPAVNCEWVCVCWNSHLWHWLHHIHEASRHTGCPGLGDGSNRSLPGCCVWGGRQEGLWLQRSVYMIPAECAWRERWHAQRRATSEGRWGRWVAMSS